MYFHLKLSCAPAYLAGVGLDRRVALRGGGDMALFLTDGPELEGPPPLTLFLIISLLPPLKKNSITMCLQFERKIWSLAKKQQF